MVDIDCGKHDEKREKDCGKDELPDVSVPDETEHNKRQTVKAGGCRLDNHISRRDFALAVAALSAKENPAENGEHIVPSEPMTAGKAVGRLGDNRLFKRSAKDYHIEKAADNGAKDKRQNRINDGFDVGHKNDRLLN